MHKHVHAAHTAGLLMDPSVGFVSGEKRGGKRNNVLQKEEGTCGLVGIKAEADGLQYNEKEPDAAYRIWLYRDAAIIVLK